MSKQGIKDRELGRDRSLQREVTGGNVEYAVIWRGSGWQGAGDRSEAGRCWENWRPGTGGRLDSGCWLEIGSQECGQIS